MRFLPERTFSSIIFIGALVLILVALATMQYRWSGQVSEAEHERMHTSLLSSMNQFRLQFNNDLQQLGFLFQPEATVLMHKDWNNYAASCNTLLDGTYFRFVRNIYLWVADADGPPQILELKRKEASFEPVPWPANFDIIRNKYGRFFNSPAPAGLEFRPFISIVHYRIPLMLHPLFAFQSAPGSPPAGMQFIGYLMIELNIENMRNELLPELAKKHFEGPDGFIYQVAVADGGETPSLVYKSDPQLTLEAFAHPDARIFLLESPRNPFRPMGPRSEPRVEPPDRGNLPPPMPQFGPRPPSPEGRRGMGIIFSDDEGPGWELLAKHREGSLEAAVARARKRNLAISFGSLLLLATSMALIIVSARRAQRLARLQIDFVAGVSHELRTPLAVICSAGDNLAEGVIPDSGNSIRKYGELIRSEGRKLAGMIEQIMQFAGSRRSRRAVTLQPAGINEIVESTLKQMQPEIAAAGFAIEKNYAPDLPRINVDAATLSRAIQNLIQNALKYSGENRWLSIRTQKAPQKRGAEVRLVVEDKGIGIGKEDMAHIFKPFYRGKAAAAAQIHGAGLGLFLVREILASMGGSVSAKSTPGKGSAFTLHLPALPALNDAPLPAASEDPSRHAV